MESGNWRRSLQGLWRRLRSPGWAMAGITALVVISAILAAQHSRSPSRMAFKEAGIRQFAMVSDGTAVRGGPELADDLRKFNLRMDFDTRQIALEFAGGLRLAGEFNPSASAPGPAREAKPYLVKAAGTDGQNARVSFEGELTLMPPSQPGSRTDSPGQATLRGELTLADGRKVPLTTTSQP